MTTAVEFIKREEALRLNAYYDQPGRKGVLTIGWGHTGSDVYEGLTVTEERADELLRVDIKWAEDAVKRAVRVTITENQRAALVSLTFNIGTGSATSGFKGSTVLRKLNAGDIEGAADAFLLWNKITVDGKKIISAGLRNRRERERALFLTGVATTAPEMAAAGQVTGGEVKPMRKSKTAWMGVVGLSLSGAMGAILNVWSQLRRDAPEIIEFIGDWAPLVFAGIFALILFNRWAEARKGEH